MRSRKLLICWLVLLGVGVSASPVQAAAGPAKQTEFTALAADGRKLIAAGQTGNCDFDLPCDADNKIVVVRYTKKGKVDRSFGRKGAVLTSAVSDRVQVNGLVVRDNGTTIVSYRPLSGEVGAGLVAFTKSGKLDHAFGNGGSLLVPAASFRSSTTAPHALALAQDGRLVVAGSTTPATVDQLAILAVTASGAPDPGFGVGGIKPIDLGPTSATSLGQALEAQPDGSLLALAYSAPTLGVPELAAASIAPDGALIGSFGDSGRTFLPPSASTTPAGVSGRSIARVDAHGILIAPAYAGSSCTKLTLRSLDSSGKYPGNLFDSGADNTVPGQACINVSDARPVSSGVILASGTQRFGTADDLPHPVATSYQSSSGAFSGKPARDLSPDGFAGTARAIAVAKGQVAVAGSLLVSRCRGKSYRPGVGCQVGAVYFLKNNGKPNRDRGEGGIAPYPPQTLCMGHKPSSCR